MDTDQHSSESSMMVSLPSAAATWASLLEVSGDSESDDLAAAASIDFANDDCDAESCSGGDDGSEIDVVDTRSVLGRECCWVTESASAMVAVGACPSLSTQDTRDAEGDRLFWEACLAHGY